jgi:nucleoside-diphosphate-sugar epimerase
MNCPKLVKNPTIPRAKHRMNQKQLDRSLNIPLCHLAELPKRAQTKRFEGHFKRNYIHVRDVANAFNFAINNSDKMNNNIYNVGLTEANISKMELCAEICKLVPDFVIKEEEFTKDPDQRNYIVSNSKIALQSKSLGLGLLLLNIHF